MSVSYDVQSTRQLGAGQWLMPPLCFHPSDLLTVPPGFKKGVDFAPKGELEKGLERCSAPADVGR